MGKHYMLEEVTADQYDLWAIHSSLLPYQVAFTLNKYCHTRFQRHRESVFHSTLDITFERFQWEVPSRGVHLELVSNRFLYEVEKNETNYSLFNLPQTKEVSLIPKLHRVDYFILQYHQASLPSFRTTLQGSTLFEMVYLIDPSQQPNELNLIFD